MKSREDLLKAARGEIQEMSVEEVKVYLDEGNDPVLVDIRGLDEWERGHLEGAVHIPRGRLEAEAEEKAPDKTKETIVYCAGGVRSLLGAISMKELGYENLVSMDGGFGDWEDAHYPFVQPQVPEEDEGPLNAERLTDEISHLEELIADKKEKLKSAS
mgnify:CR=1 FL=1